MKLITITTVPNLPFDLNCCLASKLWLASCIMALVMTGRNMYSRPRRSLKFETFVLACSCSVLNNIQLATKYILEYMYVITNSF